jgi:hypothetical protein
MRLALEREFTVAEAEAHYTVVLTLAMKSFIDGQKPDLAYQVPKTRHLEGGDKNGQICGSSPGFKCFMD